MTDDLTARLHEAANWLGSYPGPTTPEDVARVMELHSQSVAEAAARLDALEAEVARLREALGFYARERSWKSCGLYMSGQSQPSVAEIDRGERARIALEARNG